MPPTGSGPSATGRRGAARLPAWLALALIVSAAPFARALPVAAPSPPDGTQLGRPTTRVEHAIAQHNLFHPSTQPAAPPSSRTVPRAPAAAARGASDGAANELQALQALQALQTIQAREQLQQHPLQQHGGGASGSGPSATQRPLLIRRPSVSLDEACRPQKNISAQHFFPKTTLIQAFRGIEYFVMFLGLGRTGHSLIGALLDAHPNCVIANEFDTLSWLDERISSGTSHLLAKRPDFKSEQFALYNRLLGNSHQCSDQRQQGGYSYHVDGQWQGTFDTTIKVIGDKKGGTSTRAFSEDFKKTWTSLTLLSRVVNVPVRYIHVIRNPFDTISTLFLRHVWWHDEHPSGTPYNSTEAHAAHVQLTPASREKLQELIDDKKKLIETNHNLKLAIVQQTRRNTRDQSPWIDVISEDFIESPRESLLKLCSILNLDCSEEYVQACISIVMSSPSTPRHSIAWPQDMVADMEAWFQTIDWLKEYSFSGK